MVKVRLFLFLLSVGFRSSAVPGLTEDNLVVSSTTESVKDASGDEEGTGEIPKMSSMDIHTDIINRFATTLVKSKVSNVGKSAVETTFSVILPEKAFISEFIMEIDGETYKAFVKNKEEAQKMYNEAVASGTGAAIVAQNPRDSHTFTVSINIGPRSKITFYLKYEELLVRRNGQYELVVNIHPGQVVKALNVQVDILESRPLLFVKVPSLRTGNEITKNDDKLDPFADINRFNSTMAAVKFNPDENQQEEYAVYLCTDKENGLAGQFIVQYDVERDPYEGEIMVRDGYFVHFFAPTDLDPLPKHVVFVLDHSVSMIGRKFAQLVQAMRNILSDLHEDDIFHIVRFGYQSSVWDNEENRFKNLSLQHKVYGALEPELRNKSLPSAVMASKENVRRAKIAINNHDLVSATNIMEGLEVGLFLIKKSRESLAASYQPLVVFLTDGQPNVGIFNTDEITRVVTELNSGEHRSSIFSLSFGNRADKKFLQKLSLKNLGFSRHIYEAADASLQLQEFYSQISSPLLNNITFKYVDEVSEVTKISHPMFFKGSELVVAGRTDVVTLAPQVLAKSRNGSKAFSSCQERAITSLERLWAYLTINQLLESREAVENKTELTIKALDIALKYSFVTPVTSLVVVQPNKTETAALNPVAKPRPRQQNSNSTSVDKNNSTIQSNNSSSRSGPSDNIYRSLLRDSAPSRTSTFGRIRTLIRSDYRLHTLHQGYRVYSTTRVPPKVAMPQWLRDLRYDIWNIRTPQGTFMLAKTGGVTVSPQCQNAPQNTTGYCAIVFDCPEVFRFLTDFNTYLAYFCPIDKFAGVCCPNSPP